MENVQRLDLHALIPRFAPLRLHDPVRLARLVASIERQGQLMPVVAVPAPEQAGQWVLIDGYRRRAALTRLKQDRIWVDVWPGSVDAALLATLSRGPERAWEAIEEAALIGELAARYSLHAIAQELGRDVSWVSRRLSLIKALPEDLLAAVRQGRISLWAATRILAPLARANSAHARTLLNKLTAHPLSTRELKQLYAHYGQASKVQRQRLVENPGLFLNALKGRQEATVAKRLAAGPEGAWYQDLRIVSAILERLRELVPTLFGPAQEAAERARLQQAFAAAQAQFERLQQALVQGSGDAA
jgi:ParB family chromosome partitioning protein